MRLLSIHLKAFRVHADTFVEFPLGVTGVISANEGGKSTLAIEAILFAFFGASAIRGTKAGLRWNRAAPRQAASVTLRFEIGGTTYRIERGESTAKLFDEGTGTCLVEGTEALNKHSPALLGMTAQELLSSIVCQQKDLSRLASLLPGERLSYVRKMLGHERIDVGLRNCRKRKAELADERRGLEAGLGAREPVALEVDASEARVRGYGADAEDWRQRTGTAEIEAATALGALTASTTRKAEHDHLTRTAENAKTATTAAGLEITRLEEKAAQISAASLTLASGEAEVARLIPLRAQRDGLLAAKGAAGERAGLVKREASLTDEIAMLATQIQNAETRVAAFDPLTMDTARSALKDSHQRLTGLQEERARRYAEFMAEAQSAAKDAQLQAKRLIAIQDAGANGGCPTCLRALGDAFTEVVRVLRGQQDESEARAARARSNASEWDSESDDEMSAGADSDGAASEVARREALAADAAMAKRSVAEKTAARDRATLELGDVNDRLASLPTVAFDPAALSSVEAEIRSLEEKDAALARPRALVSQATETADLLTERRIMMERAEQDVSRCAAGLGALRYDPLQHQQITDAHARAQKTFEDARVALARAEEAERGAAERLHAARVALSEYDRKAERLNEVLADHLLHEKVDARLSEFRVAIAATVRPELEELTSGIVNLLTDGKHESVTITDDFSMVLNESGLPMEVTSGGTEDVAALAMRLALSQMITQRSGHDLGLLVLDEPFTSLDDTRRAGAMALLRRLSNTFPQILVVSHIPDVRDMVDHAIALSYDEAEGRTRVVAV